MQVFATHEPSGNEKMLVITVAGIFVMTTVTIICMSGLVFSLGKGIQQLLRENREYKRVLTEVATPTEPDPYLEFAQAEVDILLEGN